MKEENEKIVAFLLSFVDFLYAVLFGYVLQQTYEHVISSGTLSVSEKLVRVFLVMGVFYFLMDDWIQGRILTLRNPYRGYRRFFLEILIAFAGYGAAIRVLQAKPTFLLYIMVVLILGSYWAHYTLREYPVSEDRRELGVIRIFQIMVACTTVVSLYFWATQAGNLISWFGVFTVFFAGWLYEFIYELIIAPIAGLRGGLGVPLLSREIITRIRNKLKIE